MELFTNIVAVVQIGANRGDDDLTPIITYYQASIKKFVAVEPISLHNEYLRKCYGHINGFVIENKIITPDPTLRHEYLHINMNDGPKYEIASTSPQHIKKHMTPARESLSKGRIARVKCPVITINNLFDDHGLRTISLLVIDAEGLDLKLIKSIDFTRFHIDNIIYEHVHIAADQAKEFLTDHGYQVNPGVGKGKWSTLATKPPAL